MRFLKNEVETGQKQGLQVYARVHKTSLGEELDNRCLTTLEACLRLSVPSTRLLTLMATTRGLTKTGATATTETFLLPSKTQKRQGHRSVANESVP